MTNVAQSDTFSSLNKLALSELGSSGLVYVNFSDIRDAQKAYAKVQNVRKDWDIQYIEGNKCLIKDNANNPVYVPTSRFAGQIIIKADFSGPRQQFNSSTIGHLIKELLENYGEIMGYEAGYMKPPMVTYRAEFYNSVATESTSTYLNGFKIGVCVFLFMFMSFC